MLPRIPKSFRSKRHRRLWCLDLRWRSHTMERTFTSQIEVRQVVLEVSSLLNQQHASPISRRLTSPTARSKPKPQREIYKAKVNSRHRRGRIS
jgi:hypothetical protein